MKNAIIRTLPEAPQDSKLYGRNNAQWVEIDLSGIGTGDMNKAIYDPNLVEADVYNRSNHIGTQTSSTISDFSTAVTNTYAVQQNTAKVSFPEAPTDGTAYARMNSSWVATESFTDAPADGNEYIRKNSAWRLSDKLDDSPYDGNTYGRRNGTWINIPSGVSSVNGETGVVSLTTSDIPEGSNLYFTNSRVSSNSNVVANTAKVSFPEAPIDGKSYIRKNESWEELDNTSVVKTAWVRLSGSDGSALESGGDKTLTSSKNTIGFFRITHNLGTTNYSISAIAQNVILANAAHVSITAINQNNCVLNVFGTSADAYIDPESLLVTISYT